MNYWLLGVVCYLIAVLCVFAFVRGASERRNSEASIKAASKSMGKRRCRLKKSRA